MTTQDFAYWLQGYTEICGERPSESQWEMIKEHLSLVFKKETRNLVGFKYCCPASEISMPVDKNGIMTINNSGDSLIKGLPYITC
jgi:hypothetical protein